VPAAIGGDLDRASAGQLQHPQRLPLATLAWAGQVLAAQCFPAGPDGVQRVALGAAAAPGPLGPVDLNHPLALGGQNAREPGAVAAGALQRPAAPVRHPLDDEAQQLGVARLAARDLQLGHQPAVVVQDRGGVAVTVGVDPDDVVDLAF
jgi:hypothetical protein